jgi:lipopolysaccharide/colanic/teichoic acid biosynthesis glycosyltransferase
MTLHFSSHAVDAVTNDAIETSVKNSHSTSGVYRDFFKRFFDIALTVLSAPVVVPAVLLMALLVSLDGGNPFYSQLRVGKDGRTFRMWKLRSMVHNADQLLEAYLANDPAARAEWDSTQKLKKDPRITFVGRFLRKSSMDELPQLLNVFNGTMSLVGPRPMMLCQEDSYTGRGYYRLRPGITGLWQVSDRNHGQFIGRVYFDDLYDRTVSLKTDVQVLLQTFAVVLRGTGY